MYKKLRRKFNNFPDSKYRETSVESRATMKNDN